MTEYIDITQPVTSDMVSWPGRTPPEHSWEKNIAQGHHCNVSFWQMSAHSGTHMDSPLHFIEGGRPIDRIPPEVFIGPCVVVDLPSNGCSTMDADLARQYLGEQRLLIRTQHSDSSADGSYQPHDALLTPEAASMLVRSGMQLIGTDRLSVDDSQGDDYSIHHLVLDAGCVIVEGLQLAEVKPARYSLIATPLRLTATEASPVRAFLRRATKPMIDCTSMTTLARTPIATCAVVCGLFLLAGLLLVGSFGLTADERESTRASEEAWAFATGVGNGFSNHHTLPGYYFALDLGRAAFQHGLEQVTHIDAAKSAHAFNLLLATATLAFFALLVAEIGRNPRITWIATISFASLPIFVGHSQNNPKDLPALCTFVLAFWLLVRAARRPRALDSMLAAIALGLAINTRTLSVALLPIFAIWLAGRWPREARRNVRRVSTIYATAGAVALALWPWFWSNPVGCIVEAQAAVAEIIAVPFPVLYLGQLHRWTDVPWHYTPLHLLITTPLPILALAVLALQSSRGKKDPHRAGLVWTGVLWIVALLLLEQFASVRYDGIRHYLQLLPALCMLAGCGGDWLLQLFERHTSPAGLARAIGLGLLTLLLGSTLWETVRAHPYQAAYLNPFASLSSEPTEDWLELDYWGSSTREGAAWITEHAEPEAPVHAPVLGHLASHYLGNRVVESLSTSALHDEARPRYLLLVTRRAFYDGQVREAKRSWERVHTVQRGRGTLLEIYRNRGQGPADR